MKYNQDNFFNCTKANWIEKQAPNRSADYVSPSGSCYWYTEKGVYRFSDHWSHIKDTKRNYIGGCKRINSCYWTLRLIGKKIDYSQLYEKYVIRYKKYNDFYVGFCSWDNFK